MKKYIILGMLAISIPFLGGCGGEKNGGPVTAKEQVGWDVYKNGERVEWIDDKPGQLISRGAPPPPPSKPVIHPFISASSYDIMAEGELHKLLKKATNFQDYVRLLKESGYEVKPATERP